MLLVSSGSGQGQTGHTIHGQVVDASTGEPIPFVTLSVNNGEVSNETNRDGYFKLVLPPQLKSATLLINSINYQTRQVPLLQVTANDTIFRLNTFPEVSPPTDSYFSMERPFQTRDTLLKAVASIAKNYTRKPTVLHGFYRETIQQQQPDVYISYAEGLIDIYKPPYSFTKKSDQIRFIKGRRKPLATFKIPVLTPGPWSSNMLDIVNYQEFLFRNGQLNKEYIFELAGRTMTSGQSVYIINFKPRRHHGANAYFVGKLFLLQGSLAIVRAEYELAEQGLALLNKSQNMQIYSTRLRKRSYRANYTKFGDYWSFQSGSIENSFSSVETGSLFQSRIDIVVTRRQERDVTTQPFDADQQADYSKMRMESFDKTNDTFWDGENYLLPTRPLPELITKSTSP
ncbi:carboxypeptidase-like regulatory domain-containing protein [Spirosoma horti]